MSNNSIELMINVELADNDKEELEQLTRQLRNELQEIDNVESVKFVTDGSVLPGERVIDPIVLGAIIATVGPIVLTKFLEFLHDWAMRRERQTIKIKVQTAVGSSFEFEVPSTTSPAEVKKWAKTASEVITKQLGKK